MLFVFESTYARRARALRGDARTIRERYASIRERLERYLSGTRAIREKLKTIRWRYTSDAHAIREKLERYADDTRMSRQYASSAWDFATLVSSMRENLGAENELCSELLRIVRGAALVTSNSSLTFRNESKAFAGYTRQTSRLRKSTREVYADNTFAGGSLAWPDWRQCAMQKNRQYEMVCEDITQAIAALLITHSENGRVFRSENGLNFQGRGRVAGSRSSSR